MCDKVIVSSCHPRFETALRVLALVGTKQSFSQMITVSRLVSLSAGRTAKHQQEGNEDGEH